jgi:DNA replicative helicase MCM subunit Mcm2 (Cdc46/Mcm family)
MSREWAVQLAECEIVEKDGVMLNPERYSKDEKGYHVIKSKVEFETAEVNEISEENKEIENNEINEEKLEENKEIEENKEVSGENIMPMAE